MIHPSAGGWRCGILGDDRPKAGVFEQPDRRAGGQRPNHSGVLPRTGRPRSCLLLLAQEATKEQTDAVRSSENGGQRGPVGTDFGQWRATPDPERRGRDGVSPGAERRKAMIHPPASVRVYLCLSPCDMRRSFDGLHALVRDHLQLDPFAGHLYLFANKRRDRLKTPY